MQELIKIKTELIGSEEVNSVNARELYQALEIKKDFSNWIKAQINSLGLEKDIDFITIAQKGDGGKFAPIEYIITLDTAKHIAMASRTQKGKEVRKYFIDAEKALMSIGEAYKRSLQKKQDSKDKEIDRLKDELLSSLKEQIETKDRLIESLYTIATLKEQTQKTTQKVAIISKRLSKLDMKIKFKETIDRSPGINQSELLKAVGRKRDDKLGRRILGEGVGESWNFVYDGRSKRYFSIEDSLKFIGGVR